MKNKSLFLIMFVILTVTAVSFGPVNAQEIDISDMDNAQLLQLLQTILQELDRETDDPETLAENPETPLATPEQIAENTPKPAAEPKKFRIYENKKLILESIPEYYFYREEKNKDKDGDTGKPDPGEEHYCPWGGQWDEKLGYCTYG